MCNYRRIWIQSIVLLAACQLNHGHAIAGWGDLRESLSKGGNDAITTIKETGGNISEAAKQGWENVQKTVQSGADSATRHAEEQRRRTEATFRRVAETARKAQQDVARQTSQRLAEAQRQAERRRKDVKESVIRAAKKAEQSRELQLARQKAAEAKRVAEQQQQRVQEAAKKISTGAQKVGERIADVGKGAGNDAAKVAKKGAGRIAQEGKAIGGTISRAGKQLGGDVSDGAKYYGGKISSGAKFHGHQVSDGAKYYGAKVARGAKDFVEQVERGINYYGGKVANPNLTAGWGEIPAKIQQIRVREAGNDHMNYIIEVVFRDGFDKETYELALTRSIPVTSGKSNTVTFRKSEGTKLQNDTWKWNHSVTMARGNYHTTTDKIDLNVLRDGKVQNHVEALVNLPLTGAVTVYDASKPNAGTSPMPSRGEADSPPVSHPSFINQIDIFDSDARDGKYQIAVHLAKYADDVYAKLSVTSQSASGQTKPSVQQLAGSEIRGRAMTFPVRDPGTIDTILIEVFERPSANGLSLSESKPIDRLSIKKAHPVSSKEVISRFSNVPLNRDELRFLELLANEADAADHLVVLLAVAEILNVPKDTGETAETLLGQFVSEVSGQKVTVLDDAWVNAVGAARALNAYVAKGLVEDFKYGKLGARAGYRELAGKKPSKNAKAFFDALLEHYTGIVQRKGY